MVARLERHEKATGTAPPKSKALRIRKPPEELAYILDWYNAARGGQQRNMEVEPLSHQEILAFRTLHHLEDDMMSFDVIMMRRLDGPWFKSLPKHETQPPPRAPVGR